jgi:hypothetical protein
LEKAPSYHSLGLVLTVKLSLLIRAALVRGRESYDCRHRQGNILFVRQGVRISKRQRQFLLRESFVDDCCSSGWIVASVLHKRGPSNLSFFFFLFLEKGSRALLAASKFGLARACNSSRQPERFQLG